MEEPAKFAANPKQWRGSRDTEPANRILDEEWVDSRNVDSRIGGRRAGVFQRAIVGAPGGIYGISPYRRPDGSLHRAVVTSEGKLYDDTTLVLDGISTTNFPLLVPGHGSLFIVNGMDAPRWRDPADGVWKFLQNVPTDWKPGYATFHPLSKRLFFAPTAAGMDWYAWSNADFTGANITFSGPGGGAEYVGGNREPITSIMHGLGDDLSIYTTDHVYQIRGLDPSNWRPRFVSGDLGSSAGRATVILGHGNFFAHYSGCYLVNAIGAVTFPPLTFPRQNAWDEMVKANETTFTRSHATWNAQEQTVYLFVPTDSSLLLGQLWKFYLPDGSISISDVASYCSCYYPPRFTYVGLANGVIADLQDGDNDLGVPFTGWVRSKIYGEVDRIFEWGKQEKCVMLFKPLNEGIVRVQPIIYPQHERGGPVEGTMQSIDLDREGDAVRATIFLPPVQGWGIQFHIEGEDAWRWEGFSVEAVRQDLE